LVAERINLFFAEQEGGHDLSLGGVLLKWIEAFWKNIKAMSKLIKSPAAAATERILSLTNHLKDSLHPADDIQKVKMSAPYKFQGWMGLDKDSVKGNMVWQEYEPKTWTEDGVDIKITHCGKDYRIP
jgi:hypothetical protein